ncbi:MAG: flagellar biosynthetic protein FliR [Pseudomonadota bacterium]
MNIEILLVEVAEKLSMYVWPFARIGGFLMVMPLIGGSFVPMRIRLLLAVALTVVLAPLLPQTSPAVGLSVAGLVTMIQEIGIGVALGFLAQLVFDAIALSGQVIGMSMGLGFAVFLDRARGVNMPVLGQLFMLLGMLTFLALDGHLALIQLLAASFQAWPIAGDSLTTASLEMMLLWVGQMFVFALKIALPAIVAILVVNLSFGVMSRAAPTLNLFAVGFPVAMLLGFAVIFLNMGVLVENVSIYIGETLAMISRLLGLP